MKRLFVICWLSSALLTGCSTVRPQPVTDAVASFDGNTQNSGFLRFNADGSGVITARARERYNALITLYASRFLLPLKPDDGISPGPEPSTYTLDAQHLVHFATMNQWHKSRNAPK
jgi:hypothetical protein